MKTSLTIAAAIAALTFLGTTPAAEARPHKHSKGQVYVGGYRSYGEPVRNERYIIARDRCGNPVWGYRIVSPPVRYCPPPRRDYRPPPCPPPRDDFRPQPCPPPVPPYGGRPPRG